MGRCSPNCPCFLGSCLRSAIGQPAMPQTLSDVVWGTPFGMNSQTLNGDDTVSYSGSDVSTADTNDFDDFLQRYTFTCNPEFCIKLRRR